MKCLVTGGAGFIGGHLVDQLLDCGHEVVVVDNLYAGRLAGLQTEGPHWSISDITCSLVEQMSDRDGLSFHRRSLFDVIDGLFEGVDIVFHLAALPRPQLSINKPLSTNQVNVHGTLRVLVKCKEHGVKRLVFASSASVYGEQEEYPTPETAKPNPMSPYALQKLMGEMYCQLFTKIYGLETNCLRLFNVYGSRMNPEGEYSSLIPKFIKLIGEGKRPTIFGTGEQRRDFVHVSDVVRAMILAAESEVYGEVFNVGSGWNYSVNGVLHLICSEVFNYSKRVEPIFGPPVIEPTQTWADIRKIHDALGWEPTIGLKSGLKETQWIYGRRRLKYG